MNKRWKYGAAAAVVLLGASWAAGAAIFPFTNPQPRYAGAVLSPAADTALRAGCYDCHSHETRYVWFDYLPLASLLVGYDVQKGRRELNFSTWDQLSPERRGKLLSKSSREIRKGEMPPWYYTWLHPDARLSDADLRQLLASLPVAQSNRESERD